MAEETEIERMVVRLIGDGSEYQRMLNESVGNTREAAANIEQAAKQIEGFGTRLTTFAATAVSALASLGAMGWMKEALGNFAEAESIGIKLTATLEANGRAVDETRERYEKFAQALEQVTVHEDDAILAMLRKAESFNVTGAKAEKAVRDAISLAAATDGSAEAMIRLTAAMAKGDTKTAMRFARMVPELRGIRDEGEFVIRVNQLLAAGMKASAAETESFSGIMQILKRDFGNALEDYGKIVAEGIKPYIQWLGRLVAVLRNMDEGTKRTITLVTAIVAGITLLPPAILAAKLAFGLIAGAIKLLIVDFVIMQVVQLVSTVAWVAWTAVVLAAKAVVMLFNAQIAVWTFLLGAVTGGQVVAKIATWLWNAALTVLNALLSPVALLGFAVAALALAGTIAIVATGFALAASVVWGLYKAGKALVESLMSIGTASGPIAHVVSLFDDWKYLVQAIVRAIQVDMPLAIELMSAAWDLFINQVKDFWPPLWAFVQGGWTIVSELVWEEFKAGFNEALDAILGGNKHILDALMLTFGVLFAMQVESAKQFVTGARATATVIVALVDQQMTTIQAFITTVKSMMDGLFQWIVSGMKALRIPGADKMQAAFDSIKAAGDRALNPAEWTKKFNAIKKESDDLAKAQEDNAEKPVEKARRLAKERLQELIKNFKVEEGEGTKAAKARLDYLYEELFWVEHLADEKAEAVKEEGEAQDKNHKEAMGDIKDMDAALRGSSEAARRIDAYRDLMAGAGSSKKGKGGEAGAVPAIDAAAAAARRAEIELRHAEAAPGIREAQRLANPFAPENVKQQQIDQERAEFRDLLERGGHPIGQPAGGVIEQPKPVEKEQLLTLRQILDALTKNPPVRIEGAGLQG